MNEPNTEQNEFDEIQDEMLDALRFALRHRNRDVYLLIRRELQSRLIELASGSSLAARPITRSRVF